MKQVKLIAALLLLSVSAIAQTVTPDPGPYTPMNQKYQYRSIKITDNIWNTGKLVQGDSAQFSGVTYVPTVANNDSTTKAANTAWVKRFYAINNVFNWNFTGNFTPTDPTTGRLGFKDSTPLHVITNDVIRLTVPENGITRNSATVNKALLIDTITKKLYYGDASSGSGFVPYTGATQDVNLGEFGLQTGNVQFDNTPTSIPTTAGTMNYNDTDGTVDLRLKGGNVSLQIGQESVVRVVNKTATNIDLLEANYQAVRVTGAQGQRLKVDLAQATTDAFSAETIGLVTETINNNQEGFITTSGLVRNINTTGSLQSETWADGDILYLSPTVAGRITKVKPVAPNHLVVIGYVIRAHATQGSIYVKVDNGYKLDELHNVKIVSPLNKQGLVYNDTTNVWENKSVLNISDTSAMLRRYLDTLQAHNTRIISAGGGGGSTGWGLTGNASAVTDFLGTTNNRTMRFRTNNVERMVIDSLGRVGIGTATPTFGLDVNGTARVTGAFEVTNTASPTFRVQHSGNNTNTTRLAIYGPAFTPVGQILMAVGSGDVSFNSELRNRSANVSPSGYWISTNGAGSPTNSDISLYAFQSKSVSFNSVTEYPSAQVAIDATNKGLLIPRMTLTQRNAIASPAAGLQVIVTGETGGEFVSIYNSSLAAWVNATSKWSTNANGIHYNGGRVGIGTATPASILDMVGTSVTTARIRSTTNSGAGSYTALNDLNNSIEFGMWGSTRTGFGAIASNNAYIYGAVDFAVTSTQNIKFGTGNILSERMRLTTAGNLLLGTTTENTSAALNITSTTQGVLFPRMTTAEKTAIVTPAAGLQVYDRTLNQMSYYNGTTWVNF